MTDKETLMKRSLSRYLNVIVNKLYYNDSVVGKRYRIIFGDYVQDIDCDNDIVAKADKLLNGKFSMKEGSSLKGIEGEDMIYFNIDTKDRGVICADSINDVKKILKHCSVLAEMNLSLRSYIKEILDYAGHGKGTDGRYDECTVNVFSCRYYGGYGAWKSVPFGDDDDEDYYEEDDDFQVLKEEYCKDLSKAIDMFNKKYKLNATWQSGEKNWIYISIK